MRSPQTIGDECPARQRHLPRDVLVRLPVGRQLLLGRDALPAGPAPLRPVLGGRDRRTSEQGDDECGHGRRRSIERSRDRRNRDYTGRIARYAARQGPSDGHASMEPSSLAGRTAARNGAAAGRRPTSGASCRRNRIRLSLKAVYENVISRRCARAVARRCSLPAAAVAERRGLARVARPGPDRRLDRDRPAEHVVARPARTSPGKCRTAAVRRRWCSAIASTCRTRPAPAPTQQERLMCFNADTGKLLWEHRYNLFTSDVPPHRIAWASPAVDPATGNVFAISGNGLLMSLSPRRQAALGALARRRVRHVDDARRAHVVADHRRRSGDRQRPDVLLGPARRRRAPLHLASTRRTGQTLWVSAPEGRPTDTIYANPFVADVNGDAHVLLRRQRRRDARAEGRDRRAGLELAGQPARPQHRRAGASATTSSSRTAKRTSARSEMGMLAAVPAASKGTLTDKDARWLVRGVQAGYALAGHRRRADLPARQRRRAVRVRPEDRQAAVAARASARSPRPRRCSPTASCTSAPRTPATPAASSSSSGRTPTAPRSSTRTGSARRRSPS